MPQRIRPAVLVTSRAHGFTMIELVVVIVILAIIGGMLLPRYLNLGQDARVEVIRQTAGTLNAASAQLRARCGMTQGCSLSSGTYALPYAGQTFQMLNGYVDAGDTGGDAEIDQAINISGFTLVKSSGMHTFTKDGAPDPSNCSVSYAEAATPGSAATISSLTSGC